MTHSVAVYLQPTRNRYGIIGPIPPHEMTPAAIKTKIAACPLAKDCREPNARPCDHHQFHVRRSLLPCKAGRGSCSGKAWTASTFDEAWYAYARFNPLYKDRFAMRDGAKNPKGPTVFATQSTHKLLAALSQASMVHVRNGRIPIDHDRFNEGFMMHSSTSPLYTIIASLDVSSKMMDGASGQGAHDRVHRRGDPVPAHDGTDRTRSRAAQREDATARTGGSGCGSRIRLSIRRPGRRSPFADAPLDAAPGRPLLLGAPPGREVAWVYRSPGQLLHA